jgi:hypothetical protein
MAKNEQRKRMQPRIERIAIDQFLCALLSIQNDARASPIVHVQISARSNASLAITQRLAEDNPQNLDWEYDLSYGFGRIGDLAFIALVLRKAKSERQRNIDLDDDLVSFDSILPRIGKHRLECCHSMKSEHRVSSLKGQLRDQRTGGVAG